MSKDIYPENVCFADEYSQSLLFGEQENIDLTHNVKVLSKKSREALLETMDFTVARVCKQFQMMHELLTQRHCLREETGKDIVFLTWLNRHRVPEGICVLQVQQGEFTKTVYIRNFAMMVDEGDRNPYTVRFIKTIQWLVGSQCVDGLLWVKEPIKQRVELWNKVGLMETDERERFERIARMKPQDESFDYAFYLFLKENLLYPKSSVDKVLGPLGLARALQYAKNQGMDEL